MVALQSLHQVPFSCTSDTRMTHLEDNVRGCQKAVGDMTVTVSQRTKNPLFKRAFLVFTSIFATPLTRSKLLSQ